MSHRDFDQEITARARSAATFTLKGTRWHVHPDPPQEDLLEAFAFEEVYKKHVDEGSVTRELAYEQGIVARRALAAFIVDEERDQFMSVLEQERIGITTMRDLSEWFWEQVSGRPTKAPSGSANGGAAQRTVTPSTGGYFSTVTPPASPASASEVVSTRPMPES